MTRKRDCQECKQRFPARERPLLAKPRKTSRGLAWSSAACRRLLDPAGTLLNLTWEIQTRPTATHSQVTATQDYAFTQEGRFFVSSLPPQKTALLFLSDTWHITGQSLKRFLHSISFTCHEKGSSIHPKTQMFWHTERAWEGLSRNRIFSLGSVPYSASWEGSES